MAGHPLRPATRRRLGEPLPHQLADRPRSSPSAPCGFHLQGMPPEGRTRYYPAVGPAIPRRRSCSSRVTHPSATEPELPLVPFDLHVLGTPPAFVLSQDQTLRREPLDPAPVWFLLVPWGAGFGFVCWKVRPHRAAHPDRPSCVAFRTTVEPAGTANRTSRYQRGKRTGFWHTVQFSRCERRPEGRDSKKMGSRDPPW